MQAPVQVHFVLLPHSLALDWAGPAEALRMANQCLEQQGCPPAFELHFTGPVAEVPTSVGLRVTGLEPLPQVWPMTPSWVVLIGQPGDEVRLDDAPGRALVHWLQGLRLQADRQELVAICAGAVVAGLAGLLAGRHATTHHAHLEELRLKASGCDVVSNRLFVQDGPVWTSAGVTTGIDLMLHRISVRCGPALAAEVAQNLALALRRGPDDPELSPFLLHRNHLHPGLHRVQDAVSREPQRPWTVPAMAAVAATSPRHLARLFEQHAGVAPSHYLRGLRLALAEAALSAGHPVARAAELAGFSSDVQLRRSWQAAGRSATPRALRTAAREPRAMR